ncbi:rhodanese-like domain-containing protein [Variovorax saccharolyticus]|uniref:rhodanese-like domain-containing protein n=1 Tax=Variovorax saccharolyticus TaxID=3053516 RepID=UPI002577774A|nr:rhodanese-like domain-containing protein [Variovorax sp. J22R187]MDM0021007.1 rhodanese-like domain-containing protein [Variovorax sp. J22R187]
MASTFSRDASIAPQALQEALLGGAELALLDVREARAHVAGHLNLARLAPLSTLELEVRAMVPRLGTPVVLVDAGDPGGPASRAAALLGRLGYRDVRVLDGGTGAWQAAGLPLIDGYGTLVKAFGDRVRLHYATPALGGDALRKRQDAGLPVTVIDARPAGEYAFLTLPGASNHAGTELALRQWPAEPQAPPWAVNCFSRTRGIIAATTLRLLGHRDVHFVEDGVMQWALDGAPVVQNARPGIELPQAGDEELQRRADALIRRYDLPLLRPDAMRRLHDADDRTLYVFDLRPTARIDDSIAGVRAVPGGQLLMHFENLVGTRHARIVLLDDPHRLRAAVTAFWLLQLGQAEVYILDGELPAGWRAEGPLPDPTAAGVGPGLSPARLAALLRTDPERTRVIDVGPSADFERAHLPRARFLLPFTLDPLAALLRDADRIVFSSPDGRAARLAARDARERWPASEFDWLAGGTLAWQAAELPVEQAWEPAQLLTPFEDDWGSVMRVPAARRDRAWADYLAWERGLGERVVRDPAVRFRLW